MELRKQIEVLLKDEIVNFRFYSGKLVTRSGKEYFIKYGEPSPKYLCEAHGLLEIEKANVIKVAHPVASGENYIITEFIESLQPDSDCFSSLGLSLAQLHRCAGTSFGFYEDNYIGDTIQLNDSKARQKTDWITFYFEKRLLYQFHLAEANGHISSQMRKCFSVIEKHISQILAAPDESPSLVHGDLWIGNLLATKSSVPVLIDPAVYYGHRETDLAMTRLFGGFPNAFYESYQNEYALAEGWEERMPMYKLYHILNHLNLFGRAYLPDTEWILNKFFTRYH